MLTFKQTDVGKNVVQSSTAALVRTLVREVDAMGGVWIVTPDRAAIQRRSSKTARVSRCAGPGTSVALFRVAVEAQSPSGVELTKAKCGTSRRWRKCSRIELGDGGAQAARSGIKEVSRSDFVSRRGRGGKAEAMAIALPRAWRSGRELEDQGRLNRGPAAPRWSTIDGRLVPHPAMATGKLALAPILAVAATCRALDPNQPRIRRHRGGIGRDVVRRASEGGSRYCPSIEIMVTRCRSGGNQIS